MNNSRARKRQRREVALKNRKKQLEGWKKTPVSGEFTKERKRQKILRAENDIKILEARL
jgi:hypothetical protein